MKTYSTIAAIIALLAAAAPPAAGAGKEPAWTDPETARREDPDFALQGEYGSMKPGAEVGVQVVALGEGEFDAYVLEGGLPGLGWTRDKRRQLLKGRRDGDAARFESPDGKATAVIRAGKLRLTSNGEEEVVLPRIERTSPTLGAEPPAGAVVLFDGSSADAWENGRIENGLLAANNCLSKEKFTDYSIHIEFRTPYKPKARGQGRGNSGIYYGGRWETQVLDSFGLAGAQNECGGIYSIAAPALNMCLPPLTWQTYDVDFTAARFGADGRRSAWPRITVRLNGVVIHEDVELAKDLTTAAPMKGPLKQPEGPIFLQNHGNPVFYRNIWVVPAK